MATDAHRLAQARRAYLVAPAGFGKTYLIAETVTKCCDQAQLLLTHTHAGVRAMRSHLEEMGCPRNLYRVETISGWALRYASAYPATSGVGADFQPTDSSHWRQVYRGAVKVLQVPAVQDVVRISYAGVFVDEYQDCTRSQHALALALAKILPCRILGDPLQGIFDFEADPLDWETDVEPEFEKLPQLHTPYRWKGKNEGLGQWLTHVRTVLQDGASLDLRRLPPGVSWRPLEYPPQNAQRDACWDVFRPLETSAAIHEGTRANACHYLARTLNGKFQCMEPIECKDLFTHAHEVGEASGGQRAASLIDFTAVCLTKVRGELKTIRKHLDQGPAGRGTGPRKHLDVLEKLKLVADSDGLSPVLPALDAIRGIKGATLYRRELWDAFRKSIVEFETGEHESLALAARHIRDITRHAGRHAEKCTVSRTLLVKGLEYDHAVVLDADSLDRRQLYVALTRASRSLTILSQEEVLEPP